MTTDPAPTTDSTGAYFVSIPEMARRLALGRSTGYELVADGTIRTVSYGKRKLVPVSEIEQYASLLLADLIGIAAATLCPNGRHDLADPTVDLYRYPDHGPERWPP